MKILFLTTLDPRHQGDPLEATILSGLRLLLGSNCVDLPRKRVLYGDFSSTKRETLPNFGFTLYSAPIADLSSRFAGDADVVLYGVSDAHGISSYPELEQRFKHIWYLDGHDDSRIRKRPCFKKELSKPQKGVLPTGLGIPEHLVRPIDLSNKVQLFQKNVPPEALFKAPGQQPVHTFSDEAAYFNDISRSWFGLTCQVNGSWDAMRIYEILAAGTLLLFRDYDEKPSLCSPQDLPCFSYKSQSELESLIERLIPNGKPSAQYMEMLQQQRGWLLFYGTVKARAQALLEALETELGVPKKSQTKFHSIQERRC